MLKRMPFILLLVTAVPLFIAGLFASNKEWIDIHLHDTMFVIAQGHILGLSAFFLFLLWLVNIATHNILFSNKLTWFHTLATLVIVLFVLWYTDRHPDSLSDNLPHPGTEQPASDFRDTNAVVVCSIAALVLVQLVFIAHLLVGLYRKTTATESISV
ncbi:hypothetical protein LQ567_17850 [Niabella pedocola]|uniref:Transmembrane protein n=1 Tax=Niabella pedocola TaxID=1752077 RepID=A0ABS8PU92_9BACT|nr:hypothetical protein [Niabella pedocola]MCD2424650.1 hypothetical protein [Niabella pedocola]